MRRRADSDYHTVDINAVERASPDQSTNRWKPGILANALEECMERDDSQALNEVVSNHYKAIVNYTDGQPEWISLKATLGCALRLRFERQGSGHDLDEAIHHHRDALLFCPEGHPDRSISFDNLTSALEARFEQRGDTKDLEEVIQYNRDVLGLRPEGHPGRSMSFNNLANALWTRFEQQGDNRDLQEAIQLHRNALQLHPEGHPDRSMSLNNLASLLITRFEQQGNENDIEEAIELHRDGLRLRPEGHSNRSSSINNLANALQTRFEQRGEEKDLDEAIQLHRDALQLCPEGHPDRPMSFNNLANALETRFEQCGDDEDPDEAIQLHRDALRLCPEGHHIRSMSLNNLASALEARFEQQGDRKDLEEAIQYNREALQLHPERHPDRAMSLNNLAGTLQTRFEQRGDEKDLDEAIQLHRDALQLRPHGHPLRSSSFNNLANALERCFKQRADGKDLDEAIQLHRDALQLRPEGHPLRSSTFYNMANVLEVRFQQRGNEKDLKEAIQYHRDALRLCPEGHPGRSMSFNNLANVLQTHFEQRGDEKDIDEAIQLHRDALQLRPEGHPGRPISFNNLANALEIRFKQKGDDGDIEEAIQLHRDALKWCPDGHLLRSMALIDLAGALNIRFERQGNVEDFDEAFKYCRDAADTTTLDHPLQLFAFETMAEIHLTSYRLNKVKTDLKTAMCYFGEATNFQPGGLLPRLRFGLTWVRTAEEYQHASALEAYESSLQLLDSHVSAAASISSRHDVLKQFPPTLAVNAASCALRRNNIPRALELLEQGRALLWTQLARFRTSLDDLRSRNTDAEPIVRRFQDLSTLLNMQPSPPSDNTSRAAIDAEARRYNGLVEDWNTVVGDIRKFDGFSRFLLPPLFFDLQEAACDGPVIVMIASEFSCDAIIVLHKAPPIHIQLPTKLGALGDLAQRLRERTFGAVPTGSGNVVVDVLRELWSTVVSPVVDRIGELVKKGSRIWWCPTSIFTAFPLHAAGGYSRDQPQALSQLYISSYTPSLAALIKARRNKHTVLPTHFTAIGQALPDGRLRRLDSVEPELELVESLLPSSPTVIFSKISSSTSTKQVALRALQENHWVHFACHGKQNFAEPFKSCLEMLDEPLSLLDIVNSDMSGHEFAFLSACETAVGDLDTPDEVIHLAAGLQFMGVKSVIGTLWSVDDDIACRLVSKFYEGFCLGGKLDCTKAARALHKAVRSLTAEKCPVEQRIMFIHIGL